MTGFTIVDVLALLVVALAGYFGWRSGFIIQSLALVGFVAGLVLVVLVAPHLAQPLVDVEPFLRTTIVLLVVAGVVLVGQGLGSAAGVAVRRNLGRGVLGALDQGAGAAFGLLRGVFVVWLIGGLIGVFPIPILAAEARQSLILRALDTRLPSPVVLAAELGRVIEAAGLPDVFIGAPPAVELPENGPTLAEAERLAADARASTVRVEATACANFLTGTGFAADPDSIVTNAHVVAGAEQAWISFDGGFDRYLAEVVHFDPSLDVAVLHVDGLDADPLDFAAAPPSRGDPSVAIGFTGGGRQRLIPAVVSRVIDAVGRDIYGSQIVGREVIELRADVAPGDSGGPLVMDDGTVGGVTFSESRRDALIGYALTAESVQESITAALDSERSVATGVCLR
jgi:uncharacterized membrane protein required for colicin V production